MLRADPAVVTPFHVRVMRTVGAAEQAYGSFDLRLEGGTALAAYHLHHRESEDLDFFAGQNVDIRDWVLFVRRHFAEAGLDVPYVALSVARARGRPTVTAFPLRLLKPVTDDDVQATIELCLNECAQLIETGLRSPP